MSLFGDPTRQDVEMIKALWQNGPPRHFLERFHDINQCIWGCDSCQKEISPQQVQFHCLDCYNYDLCSECHALAAEKHPNHSFVKIDHSLPAKEMGEYLSPHQGAIYLTLDVSKHQVRLVALQPGLEASQIKCNMAYAPLFAKLDFEALSYTWGEMTNPGRIQIDGSSVMVGRNLLEALHALRYTDKPRYLWIDAICINQSDDVEKSREVQRIRHIYEQATKVVVWLGKAADGSDNALDLAASQTLGTVLHGDDSHWSALAILVRRPWWSRIWCLQELASSRWSPTMMCGTKTVPWLSMYDTCRKLAKYYQDKGIEGRNQIDLPWLGFNFDRHAAIRGQYTSGIEFRIFYLLSTTLSWEATDARDKIFGLIGLCHPGDRAALVPDYSLTVREVYEMTARYLMRESLNCLYFNRGSKRHSIPGGQFPSWIPEWSLPQVPYLWQPGCYQASSPPSGRGYLPAVLESENPNKLRVAGGLLGYVDAVSDVIDADSTWTTEAPKGLYRTIRNIESFMRSAMLENAPDRDPEGYMDPEQSGMVWRTLISDKEYPQYSWTSPASESFAKAYGALRARAWKDTEGLHDNAQDTTTDETDDYMVKRYIAHLRHTLDKRRLFITADGFFGLSSPDISRGDAVVILAGGELPFILRHSWDGILREDGSQRKQEGILDSLSIISEAYVYGAMDGKVFAALPKMIFSII